MSSMKFGCWNRWKLLLLLHFASVSCDADGDSDFFQAGRAYTERPLSGTDRVAILQRDNDEIRYNSISRGEQCILKKFVRRKPIERCENLERENCEQEFVLVRREVRENCTVQKEFCETSHRKQRVDSDTVLCQLEYDVECDDNDDEDDGTALEIARRTRGHSDAAESCHPRRTAICRRKSRMVTITEKRQKCNGDDVYRTTKMCTTNLSGVGDCVDLSRDGDFCDDRDEMKGDGAAACQLSNFDPEV